MKPGVMRWLMPMGGALICLAVSSSSSAAQRRDRIEVTVPGAKATVFERLLAAWTSEGLSVEQASADAGTLQSPLTKRGGTFVSWRVRHRAIVLSAGDSSKVVLTGTYISDVLRDPSMGEGREEPLTSGLKRELGKAWQQMERVAAALQASSGA